MQTVLNKTKPKRKMQTGKTTVVDMSEDSQVGGGHDSIAVVCELNCVTVCQVPQHFCLWGWAEPAKCANAL